MNENFTSLVFFTVLCQTAVGALIFRWLVLLRGGLEFTQPGFRRISLVVIVLLLILSLAIAFLHPGKPVHAYYAMNNLRKSWLSREIFSLSLLMVTLIFNFIFAAKNNYEIKEILISIVAITIGISLIYSMIRLYMIPLVITWNNPFTPVSFIITTLLCGVVLMVVITGRKYYSDYSFVMPLIAVLIISSVINSILFHGSFIKQGNNLFIIRTALSILSLLIITLILFRTQSNKTFIWLVILFVTVMSSEIINRYIFFLSFEKSGL